MAVGGAPSAACPGSATDPQAAAGNLCVYESLNENANMSTPICAPASGSCLPTDDYRHGFSVQAFWGGGTTAGTDMGDTGTWAVTAP